MRTSDGSIPASQLVFADWRVQQEVWGDDAIATVRAGLSTPEPEYHGSYYDFADGLVSGGMSNLFGSLGSSVCSQLMVVILLIPAAVQVGGTVLYGELRFTVAYLSLAGAGVLGLLAMTCAGPPATEARENPASRKAGRGGGPEASSVRSGPPVLSHYQESTQRTRPEIMR